MTPGSEELYPGGGGGGGGVGSTAWSWVGLVLPIAKHQARVSPVPYLSRPNHTKNLKQMIARIPTMKWRNTKNFADREPRKMLIAYSRKAGPGVGEEDGHIRRAC